VQHAHLQLFVVVDVLRHPVDSVFERPNVAFVLADLGVGSTDSSLHVLLLETQVLHEETQVGVQRVELLQLFVFRIRLQLQFPRLHLFRGDVLFQLFDAVVQNELKLLKFLGLLF